MVTLDASPGAPPRYRQIYQQLRAQILSGALAAGTRLQPTRELAQSLGISRNTAEIAYQQLCAEGYLQSRVGSGYYVRAVPILPPSEQAPAAGTAAPPAPRGLPLEYGRFHPARFPTAAFRKAQSQALEEAPFSAYCPAAGLPALQKQLQSYLQRARGVQCRPEQIIIGSGTQPLLDLVCQLLRQVFPTLRPAMEDPGYDGARRAFANNGAPPRPIPVEADGLAVDALRGTGCNLVYLTPSHQFPLGVVLPIQKRLALIQWARESGAFLLEDDYDSEFRYASLPIPSLQSLWPAGRVLYLGTMAKLLSPGLRVSYLVLPPALMALYRQHFSQDHCPVSSFTQQALTILMEKGQWDLHLRRLVQYSRRLHDRLAGALAPEEGRLFTLAGRGAGLHFVLFPRHHLGEGELIRRGAALGLQLYPLSPFSQADPPCRGIVVGFGSLSLEQIPGIARKLIAVFTP